MASALDCGVLRVVRRSHTFVPQIHLHLQCFELVGEARLDLSTHLLACPLLEAAELLVDVHGGGLYGLSRGQVAGRVSSDKHARAKCGSQRGRKG